MDKTFGKHGEQLAKRAWIGGWSSFGATSFRAQRPDFQPEIESNQPPIFTIFTRNISGMYNTT